MEKTTVKDPNRNIGIIAGRRQGGMSLVGLFLAAIGLGLAALVVMKVVPLYIADQKLTSVFESIGQEAAGSPHEIRRMLAKRLDINEVDDKFDPKDFEIRPVTGGYRVTYNYDGRAQLFGNLSLVAAFQHQTRVSN